MRENVILETSSETTTKGIWTEPNNLYVKKSLINHLTLLKVFFTMMMKEGYSVQPNFSFMNHLSMKMKTMALKVDEKQKVMVFLCSITERYTGFVDSLIYERDTVTVKDVKSGLLSEDLRDHMKEMDEGRRGSSSQGLLVQRGREEKNNWNPSERFKSRNLENGWREKSIDENYCHYKKPDH